MTKPESIIESASRLSKQMIKWRRQLHQYPELSFEEFGTSHFITKTLQSIDGMKVEQGIGVETSVVGTLNNGPGPTIALRADIDALPIIESNQVEYASKHPGVMHACGHDAHTAILLGAAHLLAELFQLGKVTGTVKFIFQPAEESTDEKGISGSRYMLDENAYQHVDAAVALHMCPWLPVGEVLINDGFSMANVDDFVAKIYGSGGHGAYPELASDPIWMLGPVLQALYGIISRRISALDAGVISIGQIHGGTASNVIPSQIEFKGTIRSFTSEIRDHLAQEIEKALAIVKPLGGDYSLEIQRGEPALNNDSEVNKLIKKNIGELYPAFKIKEGSFGMGGEDFGYVSEILPSSMFFLGCAIKDGIQRDLHTPTFDIDEACLPVGAAILTKTAVNLLRKKS